MSPVLTTTSGAFCWYVTSDSDGWLAGGTCLLVPLFVVDEYELLLWGGPRITVLTRSGIPVKNLNTKVPNTIANANMNKVLKNPEGREGLGTLLALDNEGGGWGGLTTGGGEIGVLGGVSGVVKGF